MGLFNRRVKVSDVNELEELAVRLISQHQKKLEILRDVWKTLEGDLDSLAERVDRKNHTTDARLTSLEAAQRDYSFVQQELSGRVQALEVRLSQDELNHEELAARMNGVEASQHDHKEGMRLFDATQR